MPYTLPFSAGGWFQADYDNYPADSPIVEVDLPSSTGAGITGEYNAWAIVGWSPPWFDQTPEALWCVTIDATGISDGWVYFDVHLGFHDGGPSDYMGQLIVDPGVRKTYVVSSYNQVLYDVHDVVYLTYTYTGPNPTSSKYVRIHSITWEPCQPLPADWYVVGSAGSSRNATQGRIASVQRSFIRP
jgi:hypothetical protein